MRISEVKIYTMGSAWRNFVFARLRTDEGLDGVGEARPVNREEAVGAYLDAIAHRYVLGSDPFNIEDLVLRISRNDYETPGATEMIGGRLGRKVIYRENNILLGRPFAFTKENIDQFDF